MKMTFLTFFITMMDALLC